MKILNLTDQKIVIDASARCGYRLEIEIKPHDVKEIWAGNHCEQAIKDIVNASDDVMFLD